MGVQSSSRKANGVRDDGSQAGVDEEEKSGKGVALPELEGCRRRGG